jgi:hypothetical protein
MAGEIVLTPTEIKWRCCIWRSGNFLINRKQSRQILCHELVCFVLYEYSLRECQDLKLKTVDVINPRYCTGAWIYTEDKYKRLFCFHLNINYVI